MTAPSSVTLSLGQCATLACLLEAAAPKAGNVHRSADFEDLTLFDLLASAVAIASAIDAAPQAGVGRTVLDAITATRAVVSTNTNLGIVLLLAPLAAVPRSRPLSSASVRDVLATLTAEDCRLVYTAIRLAMPGGLGKVEEMDIAGEPPADLLFAMRAAADRDLVARQYTDDFRLVLEEALPLLIAGRSSGWSLTDSIIHAHLALLARYEDSLIARKCGSPTAKQVSARAGSVLATGGPGDEAYYESLADFDFWLRADGHRRNPGTTADLVAAALFAGLRDGQIQPPYR
ncbi:MAG: triphosphoribosyl-dephospho-CoA synthase [Planctomycetaceae bacterium]|nr:triphosphoribosyl-dephospho-CoA synthase [Planctomycetaceae bacterium]